MFNEPPHNPWDPSPSGAQGHRGPEQWEEDAIAYATWQKMRRDDGEEIEDDDLVDAVFGEDSGHRSRAYAPSSTYSNSPCLVVILVLVALVVAVVVCSNGFLGY